MILYHGSDTLISDVDLTKGKSNKDFGRGFYTTDLLHQASAWAIRIASRNNGSPRITKFEFDKERALREGASIKEFAEPSEEWARFVMSNRQSSEDCTHSFDIVIGPVADDRMAQLFDDFEEDLITIEQLVKRLRYRKFSTQYFFATPFSLRFLFNEGEYNTNQSSLL